MVAIPLALREGSGALHFFLNKGHPFVDGNKRFAVAATDTFLCINNADFVGTDSEVVNLAREVADGSISLQMLSAFFRQRVQRNSWSDEQTERWVGNLQEALGSDLDSFVEMLTGALTRRGGVHVGVRRTLDLLRERRQAGSGTRSRLSPLDVNS